ncbi:MAG TPA: SDR family oxidoreductase [Polyangium sp.]|nr:SDR family oxidoreductase [Polyangium sp.]
MDLDLKGSVVFVTGASGSIGNEICRAFLDEGALVAAFSRRGMPTGDAERTISLIGDVRDPEAVDHAMRETEKRFGRVDICIACAGVWPPKPTLLHKQEPSRAREVVETNVLGSMWTARAFVSALERTGPRQDGRGASIIVIGSTAGRFGERGHSEYAASKSALRGLVASLKNEIVLVDPKARVNLVEPGWTVTPTIEEYLESHGVLETTMKTMPLRQLAAPEDVARAVLFLASPSMSRHITGEILGVTGGMEGRVLW